MSVAASMTGPVAVIRWCDDDNRLSLAALADINAALDDLLEVDGPLALVFTGFDRFFCNGVDLQAGGGAPDVIERIVREFKRMLGRLLVYPAFCVAAINGHAFGAGAILACAFDYRIMREDRGYWCVNERALGIALDGGLFATLNHRLAPAVALEAVETSHRYTGAEALASHIVDETQDESTLISRAIEIAAAKVLDREALRLRKSQLNGALATTLGFIE